MGLLGCTVLSWPEVLGWDGGLGSTAQHTSGWAYSKYRTGQILLQTAERHAWSAESWKDQNVCATGRHWAFLYPEVAWDCSAALTSGDMFQFNTRACRGCLEGHGLFWFSYFMACQAQDIWQPRSMKTMTVHALSSILCRLISCAEVCTSCRSFREQWNVIQYLGSTALLMQQDAPWSSTSGWKLSHSGTRS